MVNVKIKSFILSIVLPFLLLVNCIYAQNDKGFVREQEGLPFLFCNLPHSSHTQQNSGFSVLYNYPGSISAVIGELSLVYKNSNSDAFSIGLGMIHLLFGINKYILGGDNSSIFLNGSFGLLGDVGYLGSVGISYLSLIDEKSSLEFAFDGYFNDGWGGSGTNMVSLTIARFQTRGLNITFIYANKVSEDILLSFSAGISGTQFKYIEYDEYYQYVSKQEANNLEYVGGTKWDSHLVFPFGFTFSFHF